jgi:hypothetical protein
MLLVPLTHTVESNVTGSAAMPPSTCPTTALLPFSQGAQNPTTALGTALICASTSSSACWPAAIRAFVRNLAILCTSEFRNEPGGGKDAPFTKQIRRIAPAACHDLLSLWARIR